MIRLIMMCHEEAVPPQATLLTETLVWVAMSTFGWTQCRISVDDADQPFQVAGSSGAEERCGKSKHNSPHPEHNWLRSSVQQCLKKESQSPGGTASSTRSRNGEHSVKVSSSPAKRLTRDTEAVDTTQEGLSQRRRSYGSKPRREDRDESALRADDENVGKT